MKNDGHSLQSDFWWLPEKESNKYNFIHLCYQERYSDEPNADKDPMSAKRYFSLDANGKLSNEKQYYPLEYIHTWRHKNNNINGF